MFRFRLGRIPIEVHFSHLLFSALLAHSFVPTQASPEWPNRILVDTAHPQYGTTFAFFLSAWMLLIFVSVLVHELGHATVSLAYGYRPAVQLAWLGGNTAPGATETIPWHKDVLLTLAGPLFGLMLGIVGWVLEGGLGDHSEVARYFLSRLFYVNIVWTVLNLIPITPLDGGRVATALSMRVFGRPGFLVAQILSVACVLGVVGLLALTGDLRNNLFLVVLFGMFGWRAVGLIGAYFRGEAPGNGPVHPAERELAQAFARFQEGKLDEARTLATSALETNPAPHLRGRLHHLLGWSAVKRGEGRAALDHFSQVQGQRVEPQALAAAFSLVGDEGRALTLWELAYRETNDVTVLHEWAGALIRDGRREELSRLPGRLDLAQALACAERVLFIRGEFQKAGELAVEALERAPSPERAYDAACAFARAGMTDRAVELLQRAHSLGFKDVDYALSDSDLGALHAHRGFQEWVSGTREKTIR
jgi:Zn-dependent protease